MIYSNPRPLLGRLPGFPAGTREHTPRVGRAMSEHYIDFRNVCKTFDYPVLVDVSFFVDAGQTLAIIGRSGVGKSVSLAHIMGFLKPDSGRVIVAYQDITDFSEAELRAI